MSTHETSKSPAPSTPASSVIDAAKPVKTQACVLCKQRKIKCDRNNPCNNCTKLRVECISASSMAARRRKKRFPEAELLARIKRYEDQLRKYGADIDAINAETVDLHPDQKQFKAAESISSEPESLNTLPIRSSVQRAAGSITKPWSEASDQFREAEEFLQGSSEDEMFERPLSKTFELDGENDFDFLLGYDGRESLAKLHPSPIHIFRLWQSFLDNVNPLVHVFHAPTVQQQVLDASTNIGSIPSNLEALMFSIYYFAALSLTNEQCLVLFGEEKLVLAARYQGAARNALGNAAFMKTSDLLVLQALVLFLHSTLMANIDPRTSYCLCGIAVRIALRIGLHRDGTDYRLPPFEVEMRRRVWWHLVIIDHRTVEICGTGPSVLTYSWTTKLPLNVNDSEISPGMKETPSEHSGLTEMVFVLVKYELAQWFQKPGAVIDHKRVDEFEEHIEAKYLRYCDSSVPLHFFTRISARLNLSKVRLLAYSPQTYVAVDSLNAPPKDKDTAFAITLQIIEDFNNLSASNMATRFIWNSLKNFPFATYISLICSIRQRPTGELSDRAWLAIEESVNGRIRYGRGPKKNSALQLALGNLTVKAWEAREAAAPQSNSPTPAFISHMRNELNAKRTQPSSTNETPMSMPVDMDFQHHFGGQPWPNQNSMALTYDFDSTTAMVDDPSTLDWELFGGFTRTGGQEINDPSVSYNFYQNMSS